MCEPVTIGYILTAIGTATQYANNQVSIRRQDNEAARGIRKQGRLQEEANQRLADQIDELAGSTGEQERAQSLAAYQDAIRTADSQSTGSTQDVVGADPRYAAAVSQAKAGIRGGANERAGRLSVIDAATLQRLNEGNKLIRTETDLGEVKRRSAAEDFINKLRIMERQPNQAINAAGQLMAGVGSAMTMGAGAGGAGSPSTPNMGGLYKAGTLIDGVPVNSGYAQLFANAARYA